MKKTLNILVCLIGISGIICAQQNNNPVITVACDTIYPSKSYEFQLIRLASADPDSEDNNTIFKLIDQKSSEEIITDSIFSFTGEVWFEDFNNDNVKDILIHNISDARSNWTYHLYLVDTTHNKLTKVYGFEEVKNPTFNSDCNVIECFVVSGTNWTGFYIIENDTVINLEYDIYWEDENGTAQKEYDEALNQIIQSHNNK